MLSDLQKNFITAVREKKDELLLPEIIVNGFRPEALIDVYRNNSFMGQKNALEITYKAFANIMGDKFTSLAFEYIRNTPSRSGNLDDYGNDFPDFLKKLTFFEDKEHLIELAEFEKLYQESATSAPAKNFDAQTLATLPPEKMMDVKFIFAVNAKMLSAEHNIIVLWQENLGSSEDNTAYIKEKNNIIIVRPSLKPDVYLLNDAEFTFLEKLKEGHTLYEAFNEAEKQDENFNLESAVKNNIIRGVFTNFTL